MSNRDRDARRLHRRELLRGGVALGCAALTGGALAPLLSALPLPGARLTQRVVLVVFGGGVRSRETLGSGNTPNLDRIAADGVLYPRTAVRNVGHYGAAVSVLTGGFENFGIREDARPSMPTLFEVLRRETGLAATDVWLSTSGSDQETNYAYSTASGYGAPYGANLIGGEGIFNAEFKQLVVGQGGISRVDEGEETVLAGMRGAVETPLPVLGQPGLGNDAEATVRIERYILDELRGATSSVSGLGAGDAKALQVATKLLAIFRPRMLTVTLRAPDVAHGSFNDYVTVIRRNDAELGKLFDAIRADEELAGSTALFVLPEFGRDRDFNARRGLDHGDTSKELLQVASVAWGPDFRRGREESREVSSIDVAPTIASLFGARLGPRTGTVLPGLFA